MTRAMMMTVPDHEMAASSEPAAKRQLPRIKNRLRPYISASFPNGTMKMAAVRRYAEVTQPSVTASISNDALIAGSATFREETVYGTRKEASDATTRRTLFSPSLCMEEDVGAHEDEDFCLLQPFSLTTKHSIPGLQPLRYNDT
jgi:hypothetical protein